MSGELFGEDQKLKAKLNLRHSFLVFRGNSRELLSICDPENKQLNNEIIDYEIEERRALGVEIARRLHNYVASAKMLVEHTRRFIRKHYANTDLEKDYKAKLAAEFKCNTIVQLVEGLRDFTHHRQLPFWHNEIQIDGGSNTSVVHRCFLVTDQLLRWKGWKSSAKKYIKSVDKYLELYPLVNSYSKVVYEFHDWLALEIERRRIAIDSNSDA